ncbi:tyrosyl-DNA phosphodiesterase-domain-containing protein [Mycena capillaripes]|nr:tyrosyl-DNA phosphodiesterase-domain-containing protein [Mycena capillaripes]
MRYAAGALRPPRTPGRQRARTPNTVSLDDLIHPDDLSSAFVFSYFIENDLLFSYFPFNKSAHPRPYVHVYVGRDLFMDAVGKQFAGLKKKRPKSADFERVVECTQAGYREEYGNNFHAIYPPMHNGCAHTKMMVLVYPDFLRVVITSANLMELDVVLGDNVWFIQDFPRRPSAKEKYAETTFEKLLRKHFDFSAAKVHLVTSKPGNYSGDEVPHYGQLQLRSIVRNKILKKYTDANLPQMSFEMLDSSLCVGSVGHLENEGIVKNFLESCAGNRQASIEGAPALKMIFPTVADVENSNFGKPGANNISSHINWRLLPEKSAEYLKTVFYHYHSKDPGWLFHTKSILALHAGTDAGPDLRNWVVAKTFQTERLEKIANFECGVVVDGGDIVGMLETGNWEDIVPSIRPREADRYKEDEQPWKIPKSNFQGPIIAGDDDDDSEYES